jgi:D-alanyl-D-alanine carboxypeptidase (penicillin-binding protein 5/6)
VVDYDTRRILYADHAHERRAQASTTKITTADVALDLASPDTPITITKDAVETEPDHMGVQLNEVLSVRELLYGLLLNSGNDAAYAIADGLGGTGPFVDHMNQRASQLKLQDTRFANPAGFDDPEHYSSAYDLIVLTTDAVSRHPELKTIFSTKKQIINPTKTHGWFGPINLNNLLWDYQGAWGVKPGLTDNADYCLVAAATRDGHTILAVVMGVPTDNHFREAAKLLDYGFKRVPEEP